MPGHPTQADATPSSSISEKGISVTNQSTDNPSHEEGISPPLVPDPGGLTLEDRRVDSVYSKTADASIVTGDDLREKYCSGKDGIHLPGALLMQLMNAKAAGGRKFVLSGPADIGLAEAGVDLAEHFKLPVFEISSGESYAVRELKAKRIDGSDGYVVISDDPTALPASAYADAQWVSFDDKNQLHWSEVASSLKSLASRIFRGEDILAFRDEAEALVKPALPDRRAVLSVLAHHINLYRATKESGLYDDGRSTPTSPAGTPRDVSVTVATPNETSELLNSVASRIARHVILPESYARVSALALLHFWAFRAARTSPIIEVQSIAQESGKTVLIDILAGLSPSVEKVFDATPASLFEPADQGATIIYDEGDLNFTSSNITLIKFFNAGCKRNGPRIRRAGGKSYSAWCPKVIARIGKMPNAALASRCITFYMHRKLPGENVERILPNHEREIAELAATCKLWAETAVSNLLDAVPEMPTGFASRRIDKWEPLLAIAELAGPEWAQQARKDALALDPIHLDEPSLEEMLLHDIRAGFDMTGAAAISSAALVAHLKGFKDRPWCQWGSDGQLRLAKLLPRHIRPMNVRTPIQAKGYRREQFDELFKHYPKKSDE